MFRMTKFKPGTAKTARRREELRRILPRPTFNVAAVLQKPEFVNTALILISFLLLVSMVVVWSRDQVKVDDGQIMSATRTKRLPYTVNDEEATLLKREDARKNSPLVYTRNDSYLQRLEAALMGLPKSVAGKTSVAELEDKFRQEFDLQDSDLPPLQRMMRGDEPALEWTLAVTRLAREYLLQNPLIRSQEFPAFNGAPKKVLMVPNEPDQLIYAEAIELRADPTAELDPKLHEMVLRSGFPKELVKVVLNRLTWDPQPVFEYSEQETVKRAKAAAEAVPVVKVEHRRGDILYRRGDKLKPEQLGEVQLEAEQYREKASGIQRWQQRLGVVGLVTIVSLFIGSFAAIAYPHLTRKPLRIAAICSLMAGMLAITVFVTAYAPIFLLPAAIGPTLIVAIIILVAYDQRLALLLGGIQCMLATLALEQSVGFFILLIAGCGAMIAQLREVRNRNSLIHAATGTAIIMGIGTVMLGCLELPLFPETGDRWVRDGAIEQLLVMSISAVLTSYGVGFLVLGILPSIERLFDITTGMTLAELRDPKRPLLRQLQQRAPGTYNHSLQVANIAEAAAEAIGADSLLVYVGALYHDVGKINKPDYFVENQVGGQNKHQKLSPAMSLLVIIGHVKNGIELAREYGVPRQVQHFIESHHGTTLVEYFYHAAKTKAENQDQDTPAEVEYRYPGPKPRTKEAAILMLSDAVESATRAMTEPNPSRIENLVRKLSQKRLEDGQFDQCDLTFRELALIEEAIISRLLAVYHSRISYPTGGTRPSEQPEPRAPQAKPVSA